MAVRAQYQSDSIEQQQQQQQMMFNNISGNTNNGTWTVAMSDIRSEMMMSSCNASGSQQLLMELARLRGSAGRIMSSLEMDAIIRLLLLNKDERLREKEAELEEVRRLNSDLEEKVRLMVAENHIWFSVAKNNEALVSHLLLQLQSSNNDAPAPAVDHVIQKEEEEEEDDDDDEGYGDSDETAADDAHSAASNHNHHLRTCRKCRKAEVAVLMLPCRHLCLCKHCEPGIDTCPICHAVKKATLQISLS